MNHFAHVAPCLADCVEQRAAYAAFLNNRPSFSLVAFGVTTCLADGRWLLRQTLALLVLPCAFLCLASNPAEIARLEKVEMVPPSMA